MSRGIARRSAHSITSGASMPTPCVAAGARRKGSSSSWGCVPTGHRCCEPVPGTCCSRFEAGGEVTRLQLAPVNFALPPRLDEVDRELEEFVQKRSRVASTARPARSCARRCGYSPDATPRISSGACCSKVSTLARCARGPPTTGERPGPRFGNAWPGMGRKVLRRPRAKQDLLEQARRLCSSPLIGRPRSARPTEAADRIALRHRFASRARSPCRPRPRARYRPAPSARQSGARP